MHIEISEIPVEIKKKKIKNLHLYVKPPKGYVEVSAPINMSEESIELFLRTKLGWIKKQLEKFRNQERQSAREYVSGETLYFWGEPYYLKVQHGGKRNSLIAKGGEVILTVRENSTVEQRRRWVNEWYRKQLKEQVQKYLPKWEAITGLHPSSWQIKYMITRWGTCNTKTGKICLNLQLAKKPIECLKYVILHELVHLKVNNHGEEFTSMMDELMPYWRNVRKKLNDAKLDHMEL